MGEERIVFIKKGLKIASLVSLETHKLNEESINTKEFSLAGDPFFNKTHDNTNDFDN